MVCSSVIFVLTWLAILLVSMLLPLTSCRHMMSARRREWGSEIGEVAAFGVRCPL
jgi:hypothetical protein